MTGYSRKTLTLSHRANSPVEIRVEVDIDGHGNWHTYKRFDVPPDKIVTHRFPDAFQAYWVRTSAAVSVVATAQLVYD